jgi:hypothetical protein
MKKTILLELAGIVQIFASALQSLVYKIENIVDPQDETTRLDVEKALMSR